MTSIRRAVVATLLVAPSLLLVAEAPAVSAARCTVVGTGGDDVLRGTRGDDVVCGRGGDDVLRGFAGDDVLRGGRGHDLLDGGWGTDALRGGRGRDFAAVGRGADGARGGAGVDTISFATMPERTGVTIDLRAGLMTGPAGTSRATSFENAVGSDGQDDITGTDGRNFLRGGGAIDLISPGLGDDRVDGGLGEYWDKERWFYGDRVDYSDVQEVGVEVDLTDGTVHGPGDGTITGIEHVTGSAADDTLIGDHRVNGLSGLAGDDRLEGRDDNDRLEGGPGDDFLEPGPAAGRGDMQQYADGHDGLDVVSHVDLHYGILAMSDPFPSSWQVFADGAYTQTGTVEVLHGTAAADELSGGLGATNVTIDGKGGADTIDVADGHGGDTIIQEPGSGSTCTSDPGDTVIGC